MKEAILAIDQGTTSTRTMVFSPQGGVISSHQLEHRQVYPQQGWVEHDPEEVWQNTLKTMWQAAEQAQKQGYTPVTIGITNQRETIVAWDKRTGEVLYNAIVWQDRRTTEACEQIKEKHGETVRAKTGLPVAAYFSASKIQWLLENVEEIRQAAADDRLAFGTIECFLLWRLTGGDSYLTDITNASRTLLFDIHKKDWDDDLLEIFGVSRQQLPQIRPNVSDFGIMKEDFPVKALPVGGMAGDQQAATIGQVCFTPGMLKSTYGTGCFAMLNTGPTAVVSNHGLLTTVLYQIGEETTYGLEGSIFIAGAVVQWLRDSLQLIESAKETEKLAQQAKDHDGVYFVPAFAGLGAPYWDETVRAGISGMGLDTGKPEIVRAALDAVALQTYDLMQAMEADTGNKINELRVDGGMMANTWLVQRMADVLARDMVRPQVIETTALGAAYLAGLHHGLYASFKDISANWKADKRFSPIMPESQRVSFIDGWQKNIKKFLQDGSR